MKTIGGGSSNILMIFALALMLSGCASLQYAGVADYSVRPIVIDGKATCCEVTVRNGKEIAAVKARITKQGDSYSVEIDEQGIAAFQGQAIAAGATQAVIEAAAKAAVATALAPVGAAGVGVAGKVLAK